MTRWRIAVHALDRTGPPMLAAAFIRWLRAHRPGERVELVAFRGGELLTDLLAVTDVSVALDPHEPWDHLCPDPERARSVGDRLAALGPAEITLLVSVAAGQLLPYLPPSDHVITWAVERGEDLHWIEGPLDLTELTTRWLAGSRATAAELEAMLPGVHVDLAVEFVDEPPRPDQELARRCRSLMDPHGTGLVVVGAGIATHRKGPDLFVELAALRHRRQGTDAAFVWLGGERDPLFPVALAESRRLGLRSLQFLGSVTDVEPWLAAADVLVHPARLDAFPLVCLHATRVGTPVIAFTDVGGVGEMFGDAAMGAPYPDLSGLDDVVSLLADPERRARAAPAQRAAAGRFFADVAAPELVAACGVGGQA